MGAPSSQQDEFDAQFPPVAIISDVGGGEDTLEEASEAAFMDHVALSSSLPTRDADGLAFPTNSLYRSASDGAATPYSTTNYDAMAQTLYSSMHLTLSDRSDPFAFSRPLARESRRRTDPVYLRYGTESPRHSYTGSSYATSSARIDHDRRKDLERTELIEMILESIASVPMALEKIHTNERLRAALQQGVGSDHARLSRFFEPSSRSVSGSDVVWAESTLAVGLQLDAADADPSSDEDGSSAYDSEYENDLAEAVNQLVMTDAVLSNAERRISEPIHISKPDVVESSGSNQASNSPQSVHSSLFGASPGAYSHDGEPTAALWPRKPHQFAFTQEEEEEEVGARVQDEVYSEMMSSMCEDESFMEEQDERDFEEMEKVFEMEDDDGEQDDGLDYDHARLVLDSASPSEARLRNGRPLELAEPSQPWMVRSEGDADAAEEEEGEQEEQEEDEEEDEEREYDVFQLRVVREKNRTGFEANEDWRPRIGSVIGGQYKVQLEIGEAVFSRTYKCVDLDTDETVCLKIIKNSKEYFDQGIDEIRVLEYIAEHCDVDEKHLVRLLDYFYFREHLVIVTELLRDNLYEFSRLLLERGNINYFTMPRLKKVAIEVLEALDVLHVIGLVHCDLKPENILISNFNECRIKVIDFGSACFVTDELTSYVQSRSYRAPEVILGLGYNQKIDIWSLGCVLAELFTGEVLFKNQSEQSLLERIIGAVGPIPADLLRENINLAIQFTENPSFGLDPATGNGTLSLQHTPLPPLSELVQTDDAQFLHFLGGLLQIHPSQRLSATDALKHPWLQNGVFSRSSFAGSPAQ